MVNFDSLFNEYANTKNGDVYAFCMKYKKNSIATRFLLIRSFDSDNLKKIINTTPYFFFHWQRNRFNENCL